MSDEVDSLNMVIKVGLHDFNKNDSGKSELSLNIHMTLEIGDEWSVQIDYSQLKYLDGELSKSSIASQISTTPFPLIDKHLYVILRDCCAAKSSTYNAYQQIYICCVVTQKFERWVHMLLSRFHLFPLDIKILVSRSFFIFPNG